MDGRWDAALEVNRQIIERFPRDAEAYNRLGRAHVEGRDLAAAYDAYSTSLRLDPANMIARRNLHRLDLLRHRPAPSGNTGQPEGGNRATTVIPRTSVFIEEVGKTWVDELVDPVTMEELAEVSSGQRLGLEAEGERLYVTGADGKRLGMIEARTAERVLELMRGGNRYEVYAFGLSTQSLRVILREVYRHPSQAARVSFPRQIKATRAYLRERDLLRQRDEADFLFADEDEDEDEEDTMGIEEGEELESPEPEADAFIPDTVVVEEEEPSI